MTAPNKSGPGKETILIVDDTPTNIQILAQALRNSYAIKVAANGAAALEIVLGQEKPDLILLDIMMPEMDGYEVCRRIKQDPTSWDIPIIFVSAKDELADQKLGFDLGAVDYIAKPFEVPLVLARVNVHLRLKRKTESLERLALLDGLTDIPNRRALEEALTREYGRSRRNGTPLSLLMIDVDHFKAFNDHYGHGVGDDCLRAIAQTIEAAMLRPADFAGRYGGEEFAVILPESDKDGALVVADKIRRQVASLNIPHAYSPTAPFVTVSVGLKTYQSAEDKTNTALLQEVDRALYFAKEQGRDRVVAVD